MLGSEIQFLSGQRLVSDGLRVLVRIVASCHGVRTRLRVCLAWMGGGSTRRRVRVYTATHNPVLRLEAPENRKRRAIQITVNPQEYDGIAAKAAEAGLKPATYVRRVALGHRLRSRANEVLAREVFAAARQVKRMCACPDLDPPVTDACMDALRAMRQLINHLTKYDL